MRMRWLPIISTAKFRPRASQADYGIDIAKAAAKR